LGEAGGGRLGSEQGGEVVVEVVGQVVAEAPDVARGGAAEVEARGRGGGIRFVGGEEAIAVVRAEEGADVEGHEGEVG
jgi:hypothetical protein